MVLPLAALDNYLTRAAAVGGADLSGQMGWPHSMAQQRIPELPTGLPMGPPNGMQPDALSHQPHNPLEVASHFPAAQSEAVIMIMAN